MTDAGRNRPPLFVNIHFDGGCQNNPNGPAAGGAVLTDRNASLLCHVGHHAGLGSNNIAQWTGLVIGLEAARNLGATHLHVRGDSQLVIRQFSGEYAIRATHLQSFAKRAHAVAQHFAEVKIDWIPREQNTAADSICTAVLNGTYQPDAPSLAQAVGKELPTRTSPPTRDPNVVQVTFTCVATMDPAIVALGQSQGLSLATIQERFAHQVERKLTLAGERNYMQIVPKLQRNQSERLKPT